jgi:adhesin transport system outer membrane protein
LKVKLALRSYRLTYSIHQLVASCLLIRHWLCALLGCVLLIAQAQAQDISQPGAAEWVDAVLMAHPLVRARTEEARAAGADVQAARWQYWPTPSVNTDTLRGQAASVARLSQPLWDGGKIAASIDQAEIKQRLSVLSLRETEHELAGKVIGYWQTHSVQSARVQVLERGLRSLQDLDELMSRRTEAGVSAQADLTLARVRLMQTRADWLQSRAARTAALNQLRQLAHVQVDPVVTPRALPSLPEPDAGVEPLRELARQQHPVVSRLLWQLKLQQAELSAFKAELWPTLALRAEHQRGQIDGTLAEGKRLYASLQYSLGAGVSVVPRLEAAEVRAQALERQQEGVLKELDERLLQDWQDYAALRVRLPDLEAVQAAAQELTESSKRLFVTGRKSWLDLQNALREQLQAELAWTEAQTVSEALRYRLALHAGVAFWRPDGERP